MTTAMQSATTASTSSSTNPSTSTTTSTTSFTSRRYHFVFVSVLVFGFFMMSFNNKLMTLLDDAAATNGKKDGRDGSFAACQQQQQQQNGPTATTAVADDDDDDNKSHHDETRASTTTTTTTDLQQVAMTTIPTTTLPVRKKKKKRWAVMMMGGARTYAFTRDSFLTNIIGQAPSHTEVDVFSYSFFYAERHNSTNPVDGACHIDDMSLHLLDIDSTVLHIDKTFVKLFPGDNVGMTKDRLLRQNVEHLQLVQDYAKTNNVTYDYILLTRPDLYFSHPLNMTLLEQEIDERTKKNGNNNNATVFNPVCCKFRQIPGVGKGWCDRFTAGTYNDFSKMIYNSANWYQNATALIFEAAFRERANYVGLSDFDLPQDSYAFVTMRLSQAQDICNGAKDFDNPWWDAACHHKVTKQFKVPADEKMMIHPAACRQINRSNCINKDPDKPKKEKKKEQPPKKQ